MSRQLLSRRGFWVFASRELAAHHCLRIHGQIRGEPEVGTDFATLIATVTLSIGALIDGDGTAGMEWTRKSLRAYERLGIRNIADNLETRGSHYVNAGRRVEAVRCLGADNLVAGWL
ncbi:MAG: hypothetical protein ABI137_02315 [Antricoccus sp.]